MASVNISSMNSTNNCGVASILKKPAPQAVEATLLPAATQMFEVLSSTLAIAKIQPVPAEDPVLRSTTIFDKSLCCS